MITLVTGASGQLGRTFKDYLGLKKVFYADRSICDLSDKASISECLESIKPNRIINCAAYTDVDHAEDEPPVDCTVTVIDDVSTNSSVNGNLWFCICPL